MQLVGDKDPIKHEFTLQLRALASAKSSAKLGEATLVALCTLFLKRTTPD
jgi:ATP-dependent Lon protease